MKEQWKPIKRLPGYYASNLGRIKSKYRVLKQGLQKSRYTVSARRNNRTCNEYVHRLVAEALVKRESIIDSFVHHKNFNPLDNRSENLEWVSPKHHNKIHGFKSPSLSQKDIAIIIFNLLDNEYSRSHILKLCKYKKLHLYKTK